MKLLCTFNVNFSKHHRMRIPITRALYDAVQQETNPMIITGYTASGACSFSYMSVSSGSGSRTYKTGTKRRWDGVGYNIPEFDGIYSYCWRDSRHISIKPDFISFHKMPYERECMTSVVTLEVISHNSYDKLIIKL